MARVALYGGAFDPPHAAHLFTVTYLLSREDVDEVWLIPCGNHVFSKRMQPFELRVELLKTVVEQQGWSAVSISRVEGQSQAPSRTFDTLTNLSAQYPEHEFSWVIGADNLTESHRWHRFDDITARWPMIVLGRPGHEASLRTHSDASWCRPGPMMPMVSSTDIRATIASGLDDVVLRWLPQSISARCKKLYVSAGEVQPLKIQIFGFGRVGRALSAGLRASGHQVSSWNRSQTDGVDAFGALPVQPQADVWILAMSDDALGGFAEQLVARYGQGAGTVVLHCAGRLGGEALSALAEAEYQTGSLHPLQSIRGHGGELRGCFCAIDGAPETIEMAEKLVESVGGRPVRVPQGGKAAYHCAAVLGANFATTLVYGATALFDGIDISESQARAMLLPLLRGTLSHLENSPASEAMTGPYARRDLDAVRAHLEALKAHAPAWVMAYGELARQSARMMAWPAEELAALERCLSSS